MDTTKIKAIADGVDCLSKRFDSFLTRRRGDVNKKDKVEKLPGGYIKKNGVIETDPDRKEVSFPSKGIGKSEGKLGGSIEKKKDSARSDHGYVEKRIGKWKLIEGAGADAGWWFAKGPGETKKYKTRREAEEHIEMSVGEED